MLFMAYNLLDYICICKYLPTYVARLISLESVTNDRFSLLVSSRITNQPSDIIQYSSMYCCIRAHGGLKFLCLPLCPVSGVWIQWNGMEWYLGNFSY